MPVKPSEREDEYYARKEFEDKKKKACLPFPSDCLTDS